jgi:hypothetical protein
LNGGIRLEDLFNSKVFMYTFDFEQWPATHEDRTEFRRPYNGNLFELRNKYRDIFFEDKFEIPDEDRA